jgi:hypothetical protein
MSSLTDNEKRYLEKLFGMKSGFVLKYSDNTFGHFFRTYGIDIHDSKYQEYGTSKANKLRSFWVQEEDALVAKILSEMLDTYETDCELDNQLKDALLLTKSRDIVGRLAGPVAAPKAPISSIDEFLHREFAIPNLQTLPIDPRAVPIIEGRLAEARTALAAGCYLSVIFLCGSVLEAVLLGAAQKDPAPFNQASTSPKANDGSPKKFFEWTLSHFIDVAREIGLLRPDVQKFSHGLRDFRNYIHPYQQMASEFTPDENTAKICFQVLKAALASVAGAQK